MWDKASAHVVNTKLSGGHSFAIVADASARPVLKVGVRLQLHILYTVLVQCTQMHPTVPLHACEPEKAFVALPGTQASREDTQ